MSFNGHQLTLFMWQSFTEGGINRGNGSVQRNSYNFFLNLYEFERFWSWQSDERIYKLKDGRRPLWIIFEPFKRTTLKPHLSAVWSGVQLSMRQMTNGDDMPGLVSLMSVPRDAILNIYCNKGCSMFSINIFTLNGWKFHDCCSFLLQ